MQKREFEMDHARVNRDVVCCSSSAAAAAAAARERGAAVVHHSALDEMAEAVVVALPLHETVTFDTE